MALAPTESGSVGAGGHMRTNGVPVEGLLTLGLSELYNERRDGVQALDRRCRSLQVDVDRLRLEWLGVHVSAGMIEVMTFPGKAA